jgi:WXG100 family type VII secretion target
MPEGQGTGYGYSADVMGQSAQKIDDAHTLIRGHLTSLTGAVDSMMAGWRSQSATAFTTVHLEWDQQTRKLNDALTNMAAALRTTGTQYAAQEETGTQTFGGIVNNL